MKRGFVNTFAGNPLDRAGLRRGDAAFLKEALERPDALCLVVADGKVLLERGGEAGLQIAYVAASRAAGIAAEPPTFLGLWKETPVFAVEAAADEPQLEGLGAFHDLRESALLLSPGEAAICATARGVFEWGARNRFCATCGARTAPEEAGWRRRCPSCGAEHYPRTDPVAIMLAVYDGRCLLGRQAHWPPGMFSALAGYVEPGESIEEACARELFEEAGLVATSVRYHSSQPWPFPASLMIGLIAEVENDKVNPDPVEVADHRWLTREEARAMLAGEHAEVRAISKIAIARSLVEAWVDEA